MGFGVISCCILLFFINYVQEGFGLERDPHNTRHFGITDICVCHWHTKRSLYHR
ncbi:hypothetical protein ALTERO38_51235 [Alteromonas sp. 38]|nr:hypothetical protein ALTER154_70417 [Alteromonas sp. 154]VXB65823.1 hypothetical protein ALTERO38_51235 [Alteromonas sp. 38]